MSARLLVLYHRLAAMGATTLDLDLQVHLSLSLSLSLSLAA
jgi:hypothetical protein